MKTITPVEMQQLLTAQASLRVIDVRTPVEYDEAHIPQAINEPLDQFDAGKLASSKVVPGGEPVYFICRSGQRSEKAAQLFEKAGAGESIVVTGGTLAWIEAGLPVTRGQSKVINLERQVRIAAGSLVLTGVLLGWLVHRGFFGLAGFVGGGLIFAGVTDFCGMGLLLARMPWNQR